MNDHVPDLAPPFFVMSEPREGNFWIIVSGELDLASDSALRTALAAIEPHPDGTVWIEVADLDFVDAASLHQLLTYVRAARLSGRVAGIDGARGVVRRMAGLMGFDDELAAA